MILTGLIGTLAACGGSLAERQGQVHSHIAGFLAAIRDQTNGSGWNHLRSDVKAAYPGGAEAWVEAIASTDTSTLMWSIEVNDIDGYFGCAGVTLSPRDAIPFTLYDDTLPPTARIATSLSSGPFQICTTVGPLPWDAGIVGPG